MADTKKARQEDDCMDEDVSHPYYAAYKNEIQAELDEIATMRQEDGSELPTSV